jgi:hypothetical protein
MRSLGLNVELASVKKALPDETQSLPPAEAAE